MIQTAVALRESPTPRSVAAVGTAVAAGVRADLTFITPSDTKPVFYSSAYTRDAPRVLFESERHEAEIADMRPVANALSIDREGFELWGYRTSVTDLYDDATIEQVYYPELDAFLRGVIGATRVVIFDATRRSDSDSGAKNPDGFRRPATRVHVDYTTRSGPQRFKDLVGEDEAARLMRSGARIIQLNVWRPIRGPVERSPLAVADASSIRPADLIATDQVFPDRVGEIYHLAHHPAQRWYYAPEMTEDEVLLIKGWDSIDDGRARFTPHSAFDLPDTPSHAKPRESIEVRTFVVIER